MKEMGVTRKQLTEVFKQQYDITPSEYLIQVRISASKKMLQEGDSIQDAFLLEVTITSLLSMITSIEKLV